MTVSQLSGTSIAMIEKHYDHLLGIHVWHVGNQQQQQLAIHHLSECQGLFINGVAEQFTGYIHLEDLAESGLTYLMVEPRLSATIGEFACALDLALVLTFELASPPEFDT